MTTSKLCDGQFDTFVNQNKVGYCDKLGDANKEERSEQGEEDAVAIMAGKSNLPNLYPGGDDIVVGCVLS